MAVLSAGERARLKMACALYPFALRLAEPVGWDNEADDDVLALRPEVRLAFSRAAAEVQTLLLTMVGHGELTPSDVQAKVVLVLAALREIGNALGRAVAQHIEDGRLSHLVDEMVCLGDLVGDMLGGSDGLEPEIASVASAVEGKFDALIAATEASALSGSKAKSDLSAAFDLIAGALGTALMRLYERGYGGCRDTKPEIAGRTA